MAFVTYSDLSSSSIMAAAVANESCDAFTPLSKPCTLGNMVSFAVNATGPSDFAAAIRFSQEHNVRLVIRNTGHEYVYLSKLHEGLGFTRLATSANQLAPVRYQSGRTISKV